jgi:ATP-binding cassette subfamily B multidrug efflux pump
MDYSAVEGLGVGDVRSEEAGLAERLGIRRETGFSTLGRVVRLALRYRWRFGVATAAGLAATLFNLATPHLLGQAVDQAQHLLRRGAIEPGTALRGLSVTAAALLAVSIGRGLSQMAAGYQSETLGQQVARDLRLAYFEKLQRLGFDYHDRVHSGELITRGMLDLEGVRGFVEMGLQRLIALTLLVAIGAGGLLAQDPIMALTTFSFVPFAGWRAARMGLFLRLAWTRLQAQLAVVTRAMEENLQGVRVVRAFGAEDHEMAKFDAASTVALDLSAARFQLRATSMATISSSYYLAMALVLAVGGARVASGAMTIGRLAECLAYMTILQLPVRQMSMVMNSAARAISSGARVFEVLDTEPAIGDAPGATPIEAARGVLRFENVRFAYPGQPEGQRVLDGVSFEVGPGRTLGIVGPSGAGKSTIAQLIPRFYDVTGGRVSLDGRDVRTLTLQSLRGAVNMVAQDVFLFDDSLERNIAYPSPAASRGEVRTAAKVAHIHEHATTLASGYETSVGERGSNLSGGQRQRTSIARGLMANASVLVFDDATSAVDAATEHGLRRALGDATRAQSTIIISHRLSSLMHADEIIVLEAGRVSERGDHASLLMAGGYYAKLYATQTLAAATRPTREPSRATA